ncbi:MAG: hypothetical protein EPN91_08900 [Salinibacterium sp.]|nr:MAG: hypothetical protein EPN91_08900 [Salinibacterium sp.]
MDFGQYLHENAELALTPLVLVTIVALRLDQIPEFKGLRIHSWLVADDARDARCEGHTSGLVSDLTDKAPGDVLLDGRTLVLNLQDIPPPVALMVDETPSLLPPGAISSALANYRRVKGR